MGFRGFGSVYTRRNPWARKIDYDKEIAGDEATIAQCTQALANRWFKPDAWESYGTSPADMVVMNLARPEGVEAADVAAFTPESLGLTREEVSLIAFHVREHDEAAAALADETAGQPNRFVRGEVAYKKLVATFGGDRVQTEARTREHLRLAKAALSRHKRNKAKFGGAS